MTVKELKKLIEYLPPDFEVYVEKTNEDGSYTMLETEEGYIDYSEKEFNIRIK